MKKKIAFCLLTVCLTASGLWGCGMEEVKEILNTGTESEKGAGTEELDEAENAVDMEDAESTDLGHPILGQEDIEDYEGFEYLYCEQLRTESEKNEETGKMESRKLSVFVPIDEYVTVNRGNVWGQKLGVSYRIDLEPYLGYNEDDYLISENLDRYLENDYDSFLSAKYEGLVVGEAEEIDRNTARATVEYLEYSVYADDYEIVFATYFLKKLEDGTTVLVQIEVNSEEITGKTPELLEELEAFYQFEIDWDKQRAEKKLEDYLAEGGGKKVSKGGFVFEIPEGWSMDGELSGFKQSVYAPGGDVKTSGCMLAISEEYIENQYWDEDMLEGNEDILVEVVVEMLDDDDIKNNVSYYGETSMGLAVKAEVEMVEGGTKADAHIYWVFSGSYINVVTAARIGEGVEEDPFALAEDILANGQRRY